MYPSGAKLPDGYYIYSLINNSDMSTIAKGMITLTAVSDAYSVLLSPSSCAINAALDGSNPDLSNAKTRIQAYRGDVVMPFTMSLFRKSDSNITYTITNNVDNSKLVELTAIPNNISSGSIEFTVTIGQEYQAIIAFQFTVIRESSMLDWVQDWNGRKTSIGGEFIITPKLFVGRKNGDNTLDGIYIGPSNVNLGASYYGLYGYKASQEIFHINESGGNIGGWSIESNGIISPHGSLKLLASNQGASIVSHDSNLNVVWGIYSNGEASFAAGNVLFHSDGSASFAGSITATGGTIGGFSINSYGIYSSDHRVVIDSYNKYIGISKTNDTSNIPNGSTNTHKNRIISDGGVYLHYNTDSDYGLVGYLPRVANGSNYTLHKIFSIGSTNFIAGWSFDDTSLWIGTKTNIKNTYSNSGEITIGTEGLRGEHWYIDSDGGVSFLNGLISFEPSGGSISGWAIGQKRIYKNCVALASGSLLEDPGIYICDTTVDTLGDGQLEQSIKHTGGIYLKYGDAPELSGYNNNGILVFKLVNDSASQISSWSFDVDALYRGTKNNTPNSFTNAYGAITIGSNGIRGKLWRFESDGSGGLADNKIRWNQNGDLSVDESVTVGRLSTIPVNGNARIEIGGSTMQVYGSVGVMNIQVGVDDAGHAILKYYDNDGNFLYDLGPTGLNWADVSGERFSPVNLVYIGNSINSEEDHTGSNPPSVVTLQIYYAKRLYGIIAGGTATDNNADLAREADGKYFTSTSIVSNGSLVNYANGKYRINSNTDVISVNPGSLDTNQDVGMMGFQTGQEIEQYLIDNYGLSSNNNFNWDGSYDSLKETFVLSKNIYIRKYFMISNGLRMPDFYGFWQDS